MDASWSYRLLQFVWSFIKENLARTLATAASCREP
jgi:hypothetical protein